MSFIKVSALYPGGGKREGYIGPFGSIEEIENFSDYLENRYKKSSTAVITIPVGELPKGSTAVNPIDFEGLEDLRAPV